MDERQRTDVWGPPTRWSLVCRASAPEPDGTREDAWRDLIERYRAPVRSSVRRRAYGHADADEIADDFFAYLFERDVLPRVDADAGKFRCFMQGVIRNYVRSALRMRRPQGVADLDDLDLGAPEETPALEAQEERDWAMGVLSQVTGGLLVASPRDGELLLRSYGVPPYPLTDRETLCAETGLSRNALYQAVHRGKARLRTLLEDEIRSMVVERGDHEEEVGLLIERLLETYPELV